MWTLITFSWLPLSVAFAIGAVTGWWIWARYSFRERAINLGYTHYEPEPEAFVAAAPIAASTVTVISKKTAKKPAAKKTAAKSKAAVPRVSKPKREGPKFTALGVPAAQGPGDDLLKLKGVGPKLNSLLNGLGITRFDQIAAWKAKEIALVDDKLGAFRGRIVREQWVDQAKLLAQGKVRTFEQRFGKLDSENV